MKNPATKKLIIIMLIAIFVIPILLPSCNFDSNAILKVINETDTTPRIDYRLSGTDAYLTLGFLGSLFTPATEETFSIPSGEYDFQFEEWVISGARQYSIEILSQLIEPRMVYNIKIYQNGTKFVVDFKK